ncbi:LOW QUALITY PROTEIN: uncharacterized protein crebzf [Menidia menidia]
MITRRRGRSMSSREVQPLEVEVVDVETTEDLPTPSEGFSADDTNSADLELDDLFEDFKWSLESDASSPLFDVDLADLGVYSVKDRDSGLEVSTASSPERTSSDSRMKSGQNQSRNVNKNAIAARLNRLKKKEYVNNLEKRVGVLSTENAAIKQENCQLTKRVEELEDETRYLRAVLANESMLAQLLSRLSGVNGMKLSSSLFQGPNSNDHDYALPRKRVKVEEKETTGGVCLHVDKNHVSVEFCTKCAESASTSLNFLLGNGCSTMRAEWLSQHLFLLDSMWILLMKGKRLDKLLSTWPGIFLKGSIGKMVYVIYFFLFFSLNHLNLLLVDPVSKAYAALLGASLLPEAL